MSGTTSSKLLEGKVMFIAGVGPHIGAATAQIAAREGARVALAARNPERLEQVARSIRDEGGSAIALPCDLASAEQRRSAVDTTIRELGPIDAVFYNAAFYALDPEGQDIVDIDDETWDMAMEVNLDGAIHLTRLTIGSMIERGGGTFVYTSSNSAVVGEEIHLSYAVSKAGLNALTRFVASRYGRQGIRANAIFPFVVEGEFGQKIGALSCLGRSGTSEEVGEVVTFLSSNRSSIITGQEIHTDSGLQVKAHWPSSFVKDAPMEMLFDSWGQLNHPLVDS
jgi:NAD(P)-dependent dehydrogenase (short-subunit alcohol dehydrogenase family)